ncbi:hypothetical protein EZV62_009151 [Acer yangbiense]|uniref:Uncharacterized protein n=1 Tax=Acer yangbiense TaxID=1000413 RepID=A0A5C7IHE4_9ROSI|nr:hypothetical protein EZV62_009151 [Acer yangbiense]
MEEQEHAFELERRHLAELRLMQKPMANQPCFGYSLNDLKVSEDHLKFPSTEHFNYLLDVLNNGSTNNDKVGHVENKYTNQERLVKITPLEASPVLKEEQIGGSKVEGGEILRLRRISPPLAFEE